MKVSCCIPAPDYAIFIRFIKVLNEKKISPPELLAIVFDIYEHDELRCVVEIESDHCRHDQHLLKYQN